MEQSINKIPKELLQEFESAAKRSLKQRLNYSFIKTYKPILDDARYRSWNSLKEYREWCQLNLPDWLGYGSI